MRRMRDGVQGGSVGLPGPNGPGAGAPATELIFGEWYPALRADGLRAGKTATAMLLGVPLLLGRKGNSLWSGKTVA